MFSLSDLQDMFYMHPRATSAGVPVRYGNKPWPMRLDECYINYSDAKARAYRYWWGVYCSMGKSSRKWAITSATCMFFVVEFEFQHPETGEWWHAKATGRTSQAWRIA